MLTLKMLRDDPQFVIKKLAIKNFDAAAIVDEVLALDAERRNCQTESDALLSVQKQKAAEIGALMKQGKRDEAEVPAGKKPPGPWKPSWSCCPTSPATSSCPARVPRITRS